MDASLYTLGQHAQRRWWRKYLFLIAATIACFNLALLATSWLAVPASWWTVGFMEVPNWLSRLIGYLSGLTAALLVTAWYAANELILRDYRRASEAVLVEPRLFYRQALTCSLINGVVLFLILWSVFLAMNLLTSYLRLVSHRPLIGLSMWHSYTTYSLSLPIAIAFVLGILMSFRQARIMKFQPLEGLVFIALGGLLVGAGI